MNSNACGSSSPILSPPISPSNVVPEEPLGFHNVFALLKVFAQHNLRQEERWLHTLICCLAYDIHIFVSNAVIELYARCHLVLEAKATFDATPFPNQYTWNHLLVAYGQNGLAAEAHRVFQRLPARNVVSWNALIAAYVKNGHSLHALHVFSCMHTEGYCPDNVTFLAALDACATFAAFSENKPNSPSVDYEHSWCANVYTKKEGVQKVRYIHMAINSTGLERDVSVINALINAYGKYGAVHDAKSLFDTLQYPNFVTWTAMLAASTHSGDGEFALLLFRRMTLEGIAPTNITFACVLDASSSIGALSAGKIIHTTILHTDYIGDSLVENALLSMYGECRCMHIAEFIFTNMEFPNAVSWNSMIVTYSWNGYVKDALKFYDLMQWNGVEPDPITYVAVIHACAGLRALEEGCKLHTTVIMTGCEHRLAVASSLVSMYGNCMLVHDALGVFASVKYHDIVLWNSMLGALVLNENYKEALNLFSQMNSVGLQPDGITFCSILEVCAGTLSVKEGETVHLYVDLHGYAQHPMVGTALLDMYAKCGIISKARGVFDTLVHRSVVTWTAMVSCFAQNGAGSEALVLLQDMKNAGIELDILTFISIINACSYSGLVEEGAHYSVAMNRDYGLRGTLDFFLSIIDLLGRSGRLDEVQFMVHLVPFVEDGICWECFLASSRVHRDIDHGYQAACHCFEVDPEKASPFVALENLCVETMTFN